MGTTTSSASPLGLPPDYRIDLQAVLASDVTRKAETDDAT
jgi:hypothetical protein